MRQSSVLHRAAGGRGCVFARLTGAMHSVGSCGLAKCSSVGMSNVGHLCEGHALGWQVEVRTEELGKLQCRGNAAAPVECLQYEHLHAPHLARCVGSIAHPYYLIDRRRRLLLHFPACR